MAKKKRLRKDEFEDDDFFDDCPVCQAIKLAQQQGGTPTLSELKEAFKKAKEKGGVVGGEIKIGEEGSKD